MSELRLVCLVRLEQKCNIYRVSFVSGSPLGHWDLQNHKSISKISMDEEFPSFSQKINNTFLKLPFTTAILKNGAHL